ncbi:ribosome recycling factor [Pediococcus pentosaceus]|jgi:ribosome recycling factor|uniref:Ribosome-recycling factor n=3 Tax=Pediococcus pentosaceus TaxID=1255 RepID=RRF_PEDPA|nr:MULTISPECIES: ribosome recycling factor [Pediococcus]Q03FT3.1 RecName: Full=Ribosome-recycling factor; Short=RRF; AltName: Full=Ribosome-releasing factor [Pediococcus pentosaceus ATCC 25745]ABJ67939.1 ribosome recycling factor [Pediococcus pentosaceus ATCC 25745]AHA05005.1 ribosome recycling factor [Pediococcus pentosaceus SL4]ANI97968.1 ribosome recycling factor [Pediococcus pentosaceus]ASC08566.1 Ribosome-recycling factor [Pediococcus pentosaceus]AVL01440.1 ribosome-recycling factor [Ped
MAKNEIIQKAEEKMQKAQNVLERDLGSIRAGRANASLLDKVSVDYYGAPTPLNQMASITIPEPRVLLVTPYDKSVLNDIEQAILMSDLGINPANDGSAIRLVVPQLTEETRKDLAKNVKAEGEKAKVAVRNIRRDAMDTLKKANKNGDYNDDEFHDLEKQTQDSTDKAIKVVDEIVANKEKEVLEG